MSDALISLIPTYGPWTIFGIVALESAGVPLPGETILVAAARPRLRPRAHSGVPHGTSPPPWTVSWCNHDRTRRFREERRVFQLLHEGRFAGKSLMILVAAKRWTPLQAGKGITAAIQISIISECRYRWLHVPATTDPGDTKSPGSQPPKGGRASFSPRQSTGPRLDRPRVRSDLCRKATTSHVRTSRPTDRFLHGRNGATVDNILGSGD